MAVGLLLEEHLDACPSAKQKKTWLISRIVIESQGDDGRRLETIQEISAQEKWHDRCGNRTEGSGLR